MTAELRTWLDEAQGALRGSEDDLVLLSSETLSVESGGGQLRTSSGVEHFGRVRARTTGAEVGGPLDAPGSLAQLLQRARSAPPTASPVWPSPVQKATPAIATVNAERAASQVQQLDARMQALGVPVTAVLAYQSAGWSARVTPERVDLVPAGKHLLFARYESPLGPIVEALGAASIDAPLDVEPLVARVQEAVALAAAPQGALPKLPWVLHPSVSGPWIAALASLLGADGALSRMLGKQVFPKVFTLEDQPRHPLGFTARWHDDLGGESAPVTLVEQGRLEATVGSGAGRQLHRGGGSLGRGSLNLVVTPGQGAFPEDRIELTTRLETFVTHVRPGKVTMIAAGWEVRGGKRVTRVGPIDLDFQVLELLRRVTATGTDLRFLPTCDEVGTPSLALAP